LICIGINPLWIPIFSLSAHKIKRGFTVHHLKNYAGEANISICTGLVKIDLDEETSASYAMHILSPFFGEEIFRPIVYHKFHVSYLLQQWKAKLG
jgi:hypothetical protein